MRTIWSRPNISSAQRSSLIEPQRKELKLYNQSPTARQRLARKPHDRGDVERRPHRSSLKKL